ncbi:MAG: TraR/DksA C4-type zinc finger protein [Candidatus Cloacimonadota bacterium]|nr:TraR/DksA C4-type zinc finger protein [Candidatus Cloacimonadota bacterium]
MNKEKLESFKHLLLVERERTVKIIENIDKTWSKSIRDSVGDISAYATHMADLGTDSNEREKETYMLERELKNLKKLDQALKRIYDNTYGICRFCGKEIPESRLRAIPFAEFCIKCQRNEERINNNNRKI